MPVSKSTRSPARLLRTTGVRPLAVKGSRKAPSDLSPIHLRSCPSPTHWAARISAIALTLSALWLPLSRSRPAAQRQGQHQAQGQRAHGTMAVAPDAFETSQKLKMA